MSREVKLKPGWFVAGVRRAAERVDEWSAMPINRARSAPRRNSEASTQEDSDQERQPSDRRRAS